MYIVLIKAPNLLLKECYGLEKLGSNFLPAVQLGCIDQKVCILNLFLFPRVSEWVIVIHVNNFFSSYVVARTCYIEMRSWWCTLCA